jgi:hypothetical protein
VLHHRGQNIGGNETKTIRDGELGGAKQMTQKEMIDDVVRVYFEGEKPTPSGVGWIA